MKCGRVTAKGRVGGRVGARASTRMRGGGSGSARERRQATVPIVRGADAPTQEAHGIDGVGESLRVQCIDPKPVGPRSSDAACGDTGRLIIRWRRGDDGVASSPPRGAPRAARARGVGCFGYCKGCQGRRIHHEIASRGGIETWRHRRRTRMVGWPV